MNLVTGNKKQIQELCLSNNVKNLFAFGSVITNKFSQQSDIDFIVEIDDVDPISYSDHYFNLKFQLEKLFKRDIDLLENKAINNPFLRKEIDQTKVLVYAK